ncbi:hypothetical protein WKU26_09950 [Phocaeicola sp. HCN-40430]|uniref:type I restriction endonuclease subunit R, EcoR124 family n=1 Tax=Phocaeicola sp. HCN-40430 TaxID=3134664 RepID=UPI0030BB80BE
MFRNLEHATNESIALFGDKEAGGLVLLKTFDEYYNGYEDENGKHQPRYMELVNTLLEDYPLETRIMGEDLEKKFIRLYGAILKATNILSTFDQFAGMEILSERDVQDYHSLYIDLYEKYRRNRQGDAVNVNDDIIFEMELIKQVEINIDYILYLIEQMHDGNTGDKEIRITIQKAIGASPDLRNKRELIENFIDQLTPDKNVSDDWQKYVKEQQRRQLDDIISEEQLKPEETYHFVNQSFKDGGIQESGTGIAKILPPMSIFDKTREMKKKTVLEKLKVFFERFFDISGGDL